MEILICTDGSSSSLQSADLITKLGFPTTTHLTVLGVSENKEDVDKLTASMDLFDQKLGVINKLKRKMRYGNPVNEILDEALESPYDLVAVGGGKQLGMLHPQLGSTTSRLARKLHTHFLVARNVPQELTRILVCVGADAPSTETMKLGGAWIASTNAQVGVLHVNPVRKNKPEIHNGNGASRGKPSKETGQLHDLLLHTASQQLREAGVKTEVTLRARQGMVVEEVLNELADGGYGLLVIGAHYQPGQDRWQGTLLDDVTDQLLNRCTCSVLII